MMFHVLVEGTSDEGAVAEILRRRFGMVRGTQFQVHPHQGKGTLPADPNAPPGPTNRTLLAQLPAKLKAYSSKGSDVCVVVLLDQDDDDCRELLADLQNMLARLVPRPRNVLFRIAMEELEAWFLADRRAVRRAYPQAAFRTLPPSGNADLLDDPSDLLAECLGVQPPCTGQMKAEWAEAITPHLNLDQPRSPSLRKFIEGIERFWTM